VSDLFGCGLSTLGLCGAKFLLFFLHRVHSLETNQTGFFEKEFIEKFFIIFFNASVHCYGQ